MHPSGGRGAQKVRCGPATYAPTAPAFHGLHCLLGLLGVCLAFAESVGADPYLPDWGQRCRYLGLGLYRRVTMHHETLSCGHGVRPGGGGGGGPSRLRPGGGAGRHYTPNSICMATPTLEVCPVGGRQGEPRGRGATWEGAITMGGGGGGGGEARDCEALKVRGEKAKGTIEGEPMRHCGKNGRQHRAASILQQAGPTSPHRMRGKAPPQAPRVSCNATTKEGGGGSKHGAAGAGLQAPCTRMPHRTAMGTSATTVYPPPPL